MDTELADAVLDTNNGENFEASHAFEASEDTSGTESVNEAEGQVYRTSSDLEDTMNDSTDVLIDDLKIDTLVIENTQLLSTKQAEESIPIEVLQVLKDKFNGRVENCRPIQERDRIL